MKYFANEPDVYPLFNSLQTSPKCWEMRVFSFCCVLPTSNIFQSLYSALYTNMDFLQSLPNMHLPLTLDDLLILYGRSVNSSDVMFLVNFVLRSPWNAWPRLGNL